MNTKSGKLAAIIFAVLAVPATWAIISTLSFAKSDRICKGVVVSGIHVGGLSRNEAQTKLRDWSRTRARSTITITALDKRWSGTLADFGGCIKWQDAAGEAYLIGRSGNLISRAICVLTSGGNGKKIEAPVAVSSPILKETIKKIAKAVDAPHVDARLLVVAGEIRIKQDSCGIKVDKVRSQRIVVNALIHGKTNAALSVKADKPDVTAKDAAGIDTLLASFTTSFNPSRTDRTHNLTLASRAVNGTILNSGQVFSYNDTVGPRLEGRGFRNSPIFVKGKLEDGLGGGICQVSSTLYNVVLMTGLKVLERSPHSRTVPYVPPGRDATVAYGARDFRFENTNSSAIGVLSHVSGSHLRVDVYGSARDKKNIEILIGNLKYSPFDTCDETDPTLAPGAKKVLDKGSRGVNVTVYTRVNKSDGTHITNIVSRDRYPAQNKIWGVGPSKKIDAVSVASKKLTANDIKIRTE